MYLIHSLMHPRRITACLRDLLLKIPPLPSRYQRQYRYQYKCPNTYQWQSQLSVNINYIIRLRPRIMLCLGQRELVLGTLMNEILRAFLVSMHKSLVQWPRSLPCLVCSRSGLRWMSVHSCAWFCSLRFCLLWNFVHSGPGCHVHGDCCIIAIFFPHPPTLSVDSVLQLM